MTLKSHIFKSSNENCLLPFEHRIYKKIKDEIKEVPVNKRTKKLMGVKTYNKYLKDSFNLKIPNMNK